MLNKVINVRFENDWNNGTKSTKKWQLSGYWGGTETYFLNDKDSKEVQELLKSILKADKTTYNKGDKIYASRASEIPRFKLKEFIKENNLKKTSRYNQTDCIIINRGYFNQLLKELKYKEYYFLNGDIIIKHKREWSNKNRYANSVMDIMNVTKDLNTIAVVDDYTVRDKNKLSVKDNDQFEKDTHTITGTYINLYRNNKLKELLTVLYDVRKKILDGDVRIIFDEDMFIELNKEGIELDDDYLQTLRDMLFSSDKANVKLGFEMMSNLVLNDHTVLSISFLLNELYHTKGFRSSYYSNNSNLKSLLKLLSTRKIYWERDWKTFGTGLRLNFKDGKEGEVVKKFLLDNINREFKLSNSAAESLVDIVFTTEAK